MGGYEQFRHEIEMDEAGIAYDRGTNVSNHDSRNQKPETKLSYRSQSSLIGDDPYSSSTSLQ